MIIVDPKRKIAFTLKRFRELPEAERPTLYTHPMTASAYARADEMWKAHDKAETIGDRVNILDMWLTTKLAGWDRVQMPDGKPAVFTEDKPSEVFCYGDLIDMATEIVNASDLSFDDRKKSLSLSASGTASSAGSAGGASPAAANGA